jgi:hypothetical protein
MGAGFSTRNLVGGLAVGSEGGFRVRATTLAPESKKQRLR